MIQTLNDLDDVERIIGHPSVYESAGGTIESPLELAVSCLRNPDLTLLKPFEDSLVLIRRKNEQTYEVHVAIIEGKARKKGFKAMMIAGDWLFSNTEAETVKTQVPIEHERALMYAKVCGMKEDSRSDKSVTLSITKERFKELREGEK